MISLPGFEVHSPAGLDEALALLEAHGDGARILAGGTDLVVAMKHGLTRPAHVVWLGKVSGLEGIAELPDGSLRFGAMCTLDAISRHPLVKRRLPGIAETAATIASPQIRNRATLGGNLCINTRCFYYDHSEFWRASLCGCLRLGVDGGGMKQVCHAGPGLGVCTAVFFSDMAPVLIALGASVEVRGARGGGRTMPLSGLYGTDGSAHLNLSRAELVSAVTVPPLRPNAVFSRRKFGLRGSIDFPAASVGASLSLDRAGRVVAGSIVIGAVETRPVEFRAGVEMLSGKTPGSSLIAAVAKEAAAAVTPLPNAYESVGYRKRLVEVLVRRCLEDLAGRAQPGKYE